MTRAFVRRGWLLSALTLVACESEPTGPKPLSSFPPDEYVAACETAQAGESYASDETWRLMVEAIVAGKVVVDDTQAVTVRVAPETMSRASPSTFTLTLPKTAHQRPNHPPFELPPSGPPSLWQRFKKALSPIGTAWAHCPAFTGENYYLIVRDFRAGNSNVEGVERPKWSAMLSVTEVTPNGETWREGVGGYIGEVDVIVYRGVFSQGRLVAGPYTSTKPLRAWIFQ